jgi:hypothetical protein
MLLKRLIDPRRMRKVPPRGFGWIDHCLLREGYIGRASAPALALYLLLVCASDAQGLSYYSDGRAAELLGLDSVQLSGARRELIALGLIAYHKPLYQLLALARESALHVRQPAPGSEQDCAVSDALPAPASAPGLRAAVENLLRKGGAA